MANFTRFRIDDVRRASAAALVLVATLGWLTLRSTAAQAPGGPTRVDGGEWTAATMRADLRFEPNVGQAAADAEFVARGGDYLISLRRSEARLAVPSKEHGLERMDVVRLKLLGTQRSPVGQPLEPLASRSHYFRGSDRARWRPHVPHFARVRYANVYPGVDLEYHGNGQQLEFSFVLGAGADPRRIAMTVEGARRLRLDDAGQLILEMPGGMLRLLRPLVYQDVAGGRRRIEAQYVLRRGHRFGFQLADFDPALPLVIDPVLSYSTYLGGTGDDEGFAVAADSSGNMYVTGRTRSTNFPTVGAVQSVKSSSDDVFVSKFDASGALVYSTYLGGTGTDIGRGIAASAAGRAYVTGQTDSQDFPATPGALQTSNNSPFYTLDGFVVRLSADGSALDYSTYLGGNGNDQAFGVALDAFENAYVTGFTNSTSFPVIAAFQPTLNGFSPDAFLAKLNSSGNSLIYSTYFGGTSTDYTQSIAVDSTGSAYIAGLTRSDDLPTVSAAQPTPGGDEDAFVAKFGASGARIYSTYLGGSSQDRGAAVAVDALGGAYVTGFTRSLDFPVSNPLQAVHGGGVYDVFVTKFAPSGSYAYSTYLGGSGSDTATGIAVDSFGDAHVAGTAGSINFPIVDQIAGISSGPGSFLTRLKADGSGLVFSTGLGNARPLGIAAGPSNNMYLTGVAGSTLFPTVNPAQATSAGRLEAFLMRVSPWAPPPAPDTTPPVLTLPAGFLVEAASAFGGPANYLATAVDNVDGAIAPACVPSSGSAFPFGLTTVNCTATDAAGNAASGSFDVIVQDTMPPVLSLPASMAVQPTTASGAVVNFDATAIDAVDGAIAPVCTPASGSVLAVGVTRVNCRASDARGNTAAGFFDVSVRLEPVSVSSAEVAGNANSFISPDRSITSFDARHVAFASDAGNLVPGDANNVSDVFVRDRVTGNTVRVSVSSAGEEGNRRSLNPSISLDGRFVAFLSEATNLDGSAPLPSGLGDIFLHDRDPDRNGVFDEPGGISTIRVSAGGFGTVNSFIGLNINNAPSVSGDGRFVAFHSDSRNYPGLAPPFSYHPGGQEIYLYDAGTRSTELVSRPDASVLTNGNIAAAGSVNPSISADGRFIAFQSDALDLADTGSPGLAPQLQLVGWHIYVRDRQQGMTWVSKSQPIRLADLGNGVCASPPYPDPNLGEDLCFVYGNHIYPSISGDGASVAFVSNQRNLVPGDTNGIKDVFVYSGGQLERASVSSAGAEAAADPIWCPDGFDGLSQPENGPSLSFDGRFVAFYACPGNLDPADTNNRSDIFLRDRQLGATRLISTNFNGAPVSEHADGARISPDGSTVVFINPSGTLISPAAGVRNIYAKTTGTAVSLPSLIAVSDTQVAEGNSGGSQLAFTVSLSPPSSQIVSVDFATANGTATGSSDYTSAAGTLAFGPGEMSKQISVTVTGDATTEPDETFFVLLSNPVGASVAKAQGTGVIVNDDQTVVVTITENIAVSDTPAVLPSAMLTINESIAVTDAPLVANTARGTNVVVMPLDPGTQTSPVTVTFPAVTQPGNTTLVIGPAGPPPPAGFAQGAPPLYYDVSTTAVFQGNAQVCVSYAGVSFQGPPALWHFQNGAWVNITTTVDPNAKVICGNTPSLSPFALFADVTPPQIQCALPDGRWQATDVSLPCTASDAGSGLANAADASFVLSTLVAAGTETSDATTGSRKVCDAAGNCATAGPIAGNKVDKKAPSIACSAAPDRLWPPNHKLVAVSLGVTVADAGSGPAGFTLTSVVSNEPDNGLGDGDTPGDIQGFTMGTPGTNGWLRAERSGTGSGRRYTITYAGADKAGNSAACSAIVTVPRDLGGR